MNSLHYRDFVYIENGDCFFNSRVLLATAVLCQSFVIFISAASYIAQQDQISARGHAHLSLFVIYII